ncbi:DNA repair protein RecO [Desulfoluna butyratoxydans]|uniref:DNA repair protein RecO n=1 Tax=Desulfoluna butyratoxydans TaxID=231438 RepID=A0A4V6ILX5_9BACT|nr:DNA repair protein RecO [Desulfoluna butyratoxydans]VFQ46648.1 recombination protein o reco [Desulfoluna butyratoxydans]
MALVPQVIIRKARAILLRKVEYGDHDVVLTFLTPDKGKVSAFAKNAKKSVKRFSGVLELSTLLEIVVRQGRGLPYLEEASILDPYESIRTDYLRSAYAGYWSEVTIQWLEEDVPQERLFTLFESALGALNDSRRSPGSVSILFQMLFLDIAGFAPSLAQCAGCGASMETPSGDRVLFDLDRGGLVCPQCRGEARHRMAISVGTLKQLRWVLDEGLEGAFRVRFSPNTEREALALMERFLPRHLGREPKSLSFLSKIRST